MHHADITDTPPRELTVEAAMAEMQTINRKMRVAQRLRPRDPQERAEFGRALRRLQARWRELAEQRLTPVFLELRAILGDRVMPIGGQVNE